MRINQFVAKATGMSRRQADEHIVEKRVLVNENNIPLHYRVQPDDTVTYNGTVLKGKSLTTIALHKPTGYVCSRNGQGSKTIYELLPKKFHHLKPVGRLDKDSSGLLIMTNDGKLAQKLTHPSFQKEKVYQVELDRPLTARHKTEIEHGIKLNDGISKLQLKGKDTLCTITMHEGRNRQIRRTFEKLDYSIIKLHRIKFGAYKIKGIAEGKFIII